MRKIRIKSRIKVPSIFKKAQELSIFNFKRRALIGINLFLTALCIIAITSVADIPTRGELHEGDVVTEDIYAPFDFTYFWGIDKEKTGAAQDKAASLIYDIYTMDLNLANDAKAKINTFFDAVLKGETSYNIVICEDDLKDIISFKDTEILRRVSLSAINEVLPQPIISEPIKEKILSNGIKRITIKTEIDKLGKPCLPAGRDANLADLLLLSIAREQISKYIDKNLDAPRPVRRALLDILATQISPNLTYDEQQTIAARKTAENSIKPFYNKYDIKKGEIIIFKGQRVTPQTLAKLSEIKSATQKKDNFRFIVNFGLILLLLFFILVIYAQLFEPKILENNKGIMLICTLLIFITAIAKIIILSPLPSYLIPVSSVSMLFMLLVGNTVVLPLIIITSIIISIMHGVQFNIFLVSFIGSSIGAFVVKGARHKSYLLKAGLYLGMSNFICIGSLAFLNNLDIRTLLTEGMWGIAGGLFAAGLTNLCLPAFERMFHLTTGIGLLELADLNHPLLREMANKAPGTYHHSLIVGNLAEVACEAIGADSLLARVGAYYHDIGKIAKADYFSENEPIVSASHDDLTPSMSSLIITNHVKDGVDLAKKYRLPQPIIDMIEQHHGSGLIYYFYQKALEKEYDEETVEEEGFRYPGPKPQTKEAAVILLADSVEAASRALSEPTPGRLEELVRRITNNKFIDRQLDECQLTLQDIDTIAKKFAHILVGIYHTRVEYPNNGKPRSKF